MALTVVGKSQYQLEKDAVMKLKCQVMGPRDREGAHRFVWMRNHTVNEDVEGEQESEPGYIA